jgi:chromosome segregation ATPase
MLIALSKPSCGFIYIHFMVLHKRNFPLARLTKSLIAMNSQSESSKNIQVSQTHSTFENKLAPNSIWGIKQKARQLRRQRRRQARVSNVEVTEESSDEASHKGNNQRVPREPIERLVKLIMFLESYNKEVEQIESALGELLQKDERIRRLSAKVKDLEHSKNEEARRVEEERHRLVELQNQLNDEKTFLTNSRQRLDQEGKQLEGEKQHFEAEMMAKYDQAIATAKQKLEDESQKIMKQKEKATVARFEQAEKKIRQLQDQVSAQTEAKEDTERTLTLFKARTKELEDQKKELESRFKAQESPLSEL